MKLKGASSPIAFQVVEVKSTEEEKIGHTSSSANPKAVDLVYYAIESLI